MPAYITIVQLHLVCVGGGCGVILIARLPIRVLRCFPMNIAKFLKKPFLLNISGGYFILWSMDKFCAGSKTPYISVSGKNEDKQKFQNASIIFGKYGKPMYLEIGISISM